MTTTMDCWRSKDSSSAQPTRQILFLEADQPHFRLAQAHLVERSGLVGRCTSFGTGIGWCTISTWLWPTVKTSRIDMRFVFALITAPASFIVSAPNQYVEAARIFPGHSTPRLNAEPSFTRNRTRSTSPFLVSRRTRSNAFVGEQSSYTVCSQLEDKHETPFSEGLMYQKRSRRSLVCQGQTGKV